MNIESIKSLHFIGIGGVAMSAVAAIAKQRGFIISGSDTQEVYPPASLVLEKNGIKYNRGYSEKNILNPDLVIVSAGETPEKNPEFAEILKRKIPYVSFAEFLYNLFAKHRRIVVAGTHGKTTTSSMIAYSFKAAEDPINYMIGGYVRDFETNYELNSKSNTVLFEGDEYFSSFSDKRPKFLHYHPDVLVITNIDMDHFDYYRDMDDLMDKFRKLVKTVPPDGVIIANHDNSNVKKLLKNSDRKIIWYGLKGENLDWKADAIKQQNDVMSFTLKKIKSGIKQTVEISLPGKHNVQNALACVGVMDYLNRDLESYVRALKKFKGPTRRFEAKGEVKGITIVDDYAHHPTAVKATLSAARMKYPKQRIWAVFEPHTFSRTKATINELAVAFGDADEVIIPDIYPAREKMGSFNINSKILVDEIAKNHQNVSYIPTKDKVVEHLVSKCKKGDIIVIMAVGDFNKITIDLLNKI